MLTSITPLGERGRGQRWALTASFLFAGHLVGGAALGVLLIGVGAAVRLLGLSVSAEASLVVVAACVGFAVAFDLAGRQLPFRRQVDELWLNQYRGWVYGFGFGVQLGAGVTTVVNTMLFPAFVLAGVLLPWRSSFVLAVAYAGIRGLLSVGGGGVATIEQLKTLHRRLDRAERPVRLGEGLGLGLVVAGALAVGWVI